MGTTSKPETAKKTITKKKCVSSTGKAANTTFEEDTQYPLTIERLTRYVQEHAYYMWENENRPIGHDVSIWLKAEKEVLQTVLAQASPGQ